MKIIIIIELLITLITTYQIINLLLFNIEITFSVNNYVPITWDGVHWMTKSKMGFLFVFTMITFQILLSAIKSFTGLVTWVRKFERRSLETYYLAYYSISLFDFLYTNLWENIHYAPISNWIFSYIYFAFVFHFVSVNYSLLHNLDELYWFWKMKRQVKKTKKI